MNLKVRNISKRFKEFEIEDITLDVKEGEFFVILGPSGSGKTVILEMIAGLLKPDSVDIIGMNNVKKGFIYQDYMLFPHLNVFKNIAYGLHVAKMDKNEIQSIVNAISAQLEIECLLDREVQNLSGGEKQRVAIARAMAISPDIYLFDEPTSALDRNLRVKTRQMFMNLHKNTGSTFVHVTHDFEEALSLADRIGILMDGRIVQCGKPDDLFNHPRTKEVADFLGYRNVFGGIIANGKFNSNGVNVAVPLENVEFAYIAIRSDEIIISKKRVDSSARNALKGKVKSIIKKSAGVEVILDTGVDLSVDITRQSFEELGIQTGETMWATFKVSSIKVFEH